MNGNDKSNLPTNGQATNEPPIIKGNALGRLMGFLNQQNPFALLTFSIAFEVLGTTMMKLSEGFTHFGFGLATAVCYVLTFSVFTVALKRIPLGLAYGIWGGTGTAATALVGIIAWGDPFGWTTCVGIALIAGGIVLLNSGGKEKSAE